MRYYLHINTLHGMDSSKIFNYSITSDRISRIYKRIGIKAQGSGIRRDIVNIKSSGYSSSSIIKLSDSNLDYDLLSDSNSDFDLVIPHEIKDLILHSLLLKIASILN
ncbi:hypothetical protein P8452_46102 [Trifolium repens]|nr:hypothetical protein P8452_46102 [Trifolium repens]